MLAFDLAKRYGAFSLQVAASLGAECLVLLAPSGAGKSLTLNLVAGIVRPDAGYVRLDERTLFDSAQGVDRPIRARQLGYLLQDYALFPHLTVAGNIAYGLRRAVPRPDREATVRHWLRFFRLEGRERAYPAELSGGQQQRVALARTLAARPRALLLDEPFSALDRRTRDTLHEEFLRLKAELALPMILVTHDFVEAQVLGDHVAVLEQGRVLESGPKAGIFRHPRRHETARFLGVDNVLPVRVAERDGEGRPTVCAGPLALRGPADDRFQPGATAHLCVHAVDVRLVLDGRPRPNSARAEVRAVHPHGGSNRVRVRTEAAAGPGADREAASGAAPDLVLLVDDYVLERHGIGVGSQVTVWIPAEKLLLCE